MRRKWITKAEERKILRVYELRRGEFVPMPVEHCYEDPSFRRAGQIRMVKFEQELYSYGTKNPRIIVSLSDGKGVRMFQDIWERTETGEMVWKYRNPSSTPISDREAILDYEKRIKELEELVRKLRENI